MSSVLALNGPNLNWMSTRDPALYGPQTLGDAEELCRTVDDDLGGGVEFLQSDHEGVLIDRIHAAGAERRAGTLLGAVFRREPFRHHSYLSPAATGIIVGLGTAGYEGAIRAPVAKESTAQ